MAYQRTLGAIRYTCEIINVLGAVPVELKETMPRTAVATWQKNSGVKPAKPSYTSQLTYIGSLEVGDFGLWGTFYLYG